jgi:cation:H+ antiporter
MHLPAVDNLIAWMASTGAWAPWLFTGMFLAGSLLTVWRLEAMAAGGFEGTVLGTLIMPYCTGMGNLIFAFVLGRQGGDGADVVTNCLVNNVTNLTLLIGLPVVLWGGNILPAGNGKAGKAKTKAPVSEHQLNRLSLLLTLAGVLFFTGAAWVAGRKGKFNFDDGLMLVGLFFFWQCFHVYEVLKTNVQKSRSFSWMLPVDLALLGVGAYAVYVSTDWLVDWVSHIHTGFVSAKNLGWLSGWLTVLPNGLLAFYYGWKRQPEVVYTSQVGDGHICIPFCLGIFAIYKTFPVPPSFSLGVEILIGATLVHFFFVGLFGRLPRIIGLALVAAYGVYVYDGLLK